MSPTTRRCTPDLVLMDIRMPIMDGLEATKHIAASSVRSRVLIVTTFDEDEHVFRALRAGASGFMLKDSPPERLLEAIRLVAAGEALLSPTVTRRLISAFVDRVPATNSERPLVGVTERERDALAQLAIGRSNAEIAETLVISIPTVKTHVSRLLAKLQARDRAQLVVIAYETGVVRVGS
ncbi:MAG: response regulator [Nakamurella sp.]